MLVVYETICRVPWGCQAAILKVFVISGGKSMENVGKWGDTDYLI